MASNSRQNHLPPTHEAWLPREHALYRPRHAKKQLTALFCATVFFSVQLITPTFGARAENIENRELTGFPSPTQGWEFFTQLSRWATDHLVFRKDAIDIAGWASRTIFGEPPPLGEGNRQEGPIPAPDPSRDKTEFPTVIEGNHDWLYLGSEISSHCEAQPLEDTLRRLTKIRDAVKKTGRDFIVVVAPDKATIVPQYLPDHYVGRDCHRSMRTKFWRSVRETDYIIDLRNDIRSWGDRIGVPVYGSQDAHWSDEGGLAMTRAIAERLQPNLSESWRVKPSQTWQVPADLARMIGQTAYTTGRDYALMPGGEENKTSDVTSGFKTPLRLSSTSGPGTHRSSVAYFGDSFTKRCLPYLAAVFRDMTILHHATAQQDQGDSIAQIIKNSETVVLEVAERSLVRGTLPLLNQPALGNIINKISR